MATENTEEIADGPMTSPNWSRRRRNRVSARRSARPPSAPFRVFRGNSLFRPARALI